MLYQIQCVLPTRSYPLNALPLLSLSGGLASAYSPPPYLSHGHGGWGPEVRPWWEREEIRKRILKDDEEVLEVIMGIVLSGRL